jgi:hypothetical protein
MSFVAVEAAEFVRFLVILIEGQEASLNVVREELRRRLREGEPSGMWAAAEVILEGQLSASMRALHVAAAFVASLPPPPPSRDGRPPPPPPPPPACF